jgi:hypothetical protein
MAVHDFRYDSLKRFAIVNHPSGELTAKGTPRQTFYGRCSNAANQIEDRFNLQRWAERRLLIGTTQLDPVLLKEISTLDPDDEAERKLIDSVVVNAKELAGTFLAASRGTHAHLLTEFLDRGEECPLSVIVSGAELGIDEYVADAVTKAWDRLCERAGLKMLCVEPMCIDDHWRLAGHIDRIAETTQPLRFNNRVTIPAGIPIICDIKTGRLRVNLDGSPLFWNGYSVQIASYAHSQRYIVEEPGVNEYREPWEFDISQRHAVIAHIDVGNALEERVCTAQLLHVDVVAGLTAGNLARQARDWQASTGLFAEQPDPPIAVSVRDPF